MSKALYSNLPTQYLPQDSKSAILHLKHRFGLLQGFIGARCSTGVSQQRCSNDRYRDHCRAHRCAGCALWCWRGSASRVRTASTAGSRATTAAAAPAAAPCCTSTIAALAARHAAACAGCKADGRSAARGRVDERQRLQKQKVRLLCMCPYSHERLSDRECRYVTTAEQTGSQGLLVPLCTAYGRCSPHTDGNCGRPAAPLADQSAKTSEAKLGRCNVRAP